MELEMDEYEKDCLMTEIIDNAKTLETFMESFQSSYYPEYLIIGTLQAIKRINDKIRLIDSGLNEMRKDLINTQEKIQKIKK